MLKIIMLRHGRTYGNTLGRYVGTTNESILPGEKEAIVPINELMDVVFSSPMKRCLETVNILFPVLPKEKLIIMDGLKECDFGEFENMNYQELTENPDYQKWIDSDGTIGFPGGESRMEFKTRILNAFDEIIKYCRKSHCQKIGMVVHGGTIMSIMEAYGFPHKDYFDWNVKNGEGYWLRTRIDRWDRGEHQIIVDRYIERSEED